MPVTVLVEFPGDGFLNQFLQIGGGGFLSLELKGKVKQRKENKKSLYHMRGRSRKERLRLEKPEPLKEFTSMSWLELKRDGLPLHREWLSPPPSERFRPPEQEWCNSLGSWQKTLVVGQLEYPSVWPMT